MSDTATLDNQLNQDILSGKAMEAFEACYADDVVMQENSEEPRRGKEANREIEKQFFESIEEFHGAKLHASAVNGDVTFSQWEWDVTFKGASRVQMNQVAVHHWKNGKVSSERIYYTK